MPDALEGVIGVAACLLLKNLAWLSVSLRKKTQVGKVGQLIFYPIKSCVGIQLNEAEICDGGIVYNGVRDRSYIIMSATDRRFVSLKMFTPLTKVLPAVDPNKFGGILLTADGQPNLPVTHTDNEVIVIFKTETIAGVDCGDKAAQWLNAVCDRTDLRLVYCPNRPRSVEDRMRLLDTQKKMYSVYSSLKESPSNYISFADKSPIMIMSDVSIKTLNKALKDTHSGTDWRNFRPNIVVSENTSDADEDRWGYIFGENFALAGAFPCERCVMVNLDHHLKEVKAPPGEPVLAALKEYRAQNAFKNPLLGVCCTVEKTGMIRLGEALYADL